MVSQESSCEWADWCYENTAKLLASQFPQAWIWMIEPVAREDEIFSCYNNFVREDLVEVQCFDKRDALLHLQLLLRSAVDLVNGYFSGAEQEQVHQLNKIAESEDQMATADRDKVVKLDIPIMLVGFSKGCVVLNQLLHELREAENKPDLNHFVQSISAWYWLDGGHIMESHTWITDEDVLQDLAKLKVPINVLVTPYQVKDPNRPYIGDEERLFVDILKKLGADVKEKLYFENEELSLENHFKVLEKIHDIR